MSEIIDVMTVENLDAPFFPVDLDEDFVNMEYLNANFLLKNSSGASIFQKGDCLVIISACFVLPECFTIGYDLVNPYLPNRLRLYLYSPAGSFDLPTWEEHIYRLPELGTDSTVCIPMENYECVFNIFADVNKAVKINAPNAGTLLSTSFSLCHIFDGINISMKNIPATYDGTVQKVFPFVKVLHNFPLLTPP